MANVCSFEFRVRGKEVNCYAFLNSNIPCYEIYEAGKYGTAEDTVLCICGECRWGLTSMTKADPPISEIAKRCNVELEMFGYDISEPFWVQHFHYKGDECLCAFNLPSYIQNPDEADIETEDLEKYTFDETHRIYVLNPEHNEVFSWDEDNEQMEVQWSISLI